MFGNRSSYVGNLLNFRVGAGLFNGHQIKNEK